MDAAKKARLEAAGYAVEDGVQEFLGLTDVEAAMVEIKLAMALAVKAERTARHWSQARLAKLLQTKQPNVARLERGDGSIDQLTKTLVALGVGRDRLGELVAG